MGRERERERERVHMYRIVKRNNKKFEKIDYLIERGSRIYELM